MKCYNYQEIKNMYGKLSPFEFKDKLLNIAKVTAKENSRQLLDAGRGNPNWTNSTAREAFFTFGNFSVSESRRNWDLGNLSGMPKKVGISKRFYDYINKNIDMPGAHLAKEIIEYGIDELGFDKDEFIYELADGIIGDNYPLPDRMLPHIEKIVHDYLVKEMKYDINGKYGDVEIFAVEGATAAMCYIFDSLMANELLKRGDKIALMTPIFTPYLEIPHLPRYNFEIVHVNADTIDKDGNNTWQYSRDELKKLEDKSIKALFVVNPNNPASVALDETSYNNLIDVVQNYNKDLMIISDDVYGTFVNNFHSLMSRLPFNTIGVYSYSKYFGVTGWRLGTFALHKSNVFDKKIKSLSNELKATVNKRYSDMSIDPSNLTFMERVVADSRMVALNHTAGLSTPQQVQMAFFSAFALIDKVDAYKKLSMSICHRRIKLLYNALGLPLKLAQNNASYYTVLNIEKWAKTYHGEEFFEFINKKYSLVDVLYKLANDYSTVLLSGDGFAGPKWSLRVSLANLNDDAYTDIGNAIKNIFTEYENEWYKTKKI
ncbi:aspartate 4-decarboxylase [Clostridioides mangenotii]|uniref:aspartate 4-decarboxylase n=1 Tax=Metaclostridioides mangenotii TaxID=1540 RepID=UPI001C106475|nr:aspartate 4-decarboxylase [Clostridioides mangenotii]MBU5307654.1 aspartate 4-decarboxylase [Clostridioides mangenotii]